MFHYVMLSDSTNVLIKCGRIMNVFPADFVRITDNSISTPFRIPHKIRETKQLMMEFNKANSKYSIHILMWDALRVRASAIYGR